MVQKLTYTQYGDYYIPDIKLAHTGTQALSKYGRMRRAFLEQNKPMLFSDMVLTEMLFPHLWEVQQTCEKQMIYNEGWPEWSAFFLWIHNS